MSNAHSKLRNLGIVLIVLGLFCTIFAPLVSASIALVIGIALTIGAVFNIYLIFSDGGSRKILNILFSLLTLWAGLFMVLHPVLGIMTLVQVAMIYFLVGGIFDIAGAFQIKPSKNWWLPLVMGILNLIFAVILISRADIAIWLLGFLIGINLTIKGSILLVASHTD